VGIDKYNKIHLHFYKILKHLGTIIYVRVGRVGDPRFGMLNPNFLLF